jgi:hypothetical protein
MVCRFGGQAVQFVEEGQIGNLGSFAAMTPQQFSDILRFANLTESDLYFTYGVIARTPDNQWDSTNFELLLQYASEHGKIFAVASCENLPKLLNYFIYTSVRNYRACLGAEQRAQCPAPRVQLYHKSTAARR